jgi:hypothetical protein
MLQSKRNELTESILRKLKQKGMPISASIDVMPEMDQEGNPVDGELDPMSHQVQAAPSNLLAKLRKRKPLPDEEDGLADE